MKVTSKGQVTIPQAVREALGIRPSVTEVEFKQDRQGRWYLAKMPQKNTGQSRFRTAHNAGKLRMSTEALLALTRDRTWE